MLDQSHFSFYVYSGEESHRFSQFGVQDKNLIIGILDGTRTKNEIKEIKISV